MKYGLGHTIKRTHYVNNSPIIICLTRIINNPSDIRYDMANSHAKGIMYDMANSHPKGIVRCRVLSQLKYFGTLMVKGVEVELELSSFLVFAREPSIGQGRFTQFELIE